MRTRGIVAILGLALALLTATVPQARAQVGLPATLIADHVQVDPSGRLLARGSVEIWHGSVRLTASRVVFDRRGDQLLVEGPLTLSEGPETVILADSAQINPQLRAGILHSARLMLDQQLQIAAAELEQSANGVRELRSVVASSCEVCAARPTPLWEIRADSVTHDPGTNRLLFRRAQLRLAGVPVFYTPRMVLPAPGNTRLRGLLRPEISLDSDLGLSVGLPYFLPFGDSRDLTLTPTVSTEGMASLGFRWRAARPDGGVEIGGRVARDDLLPGQWRGHLYLRALVRLSRGWELTANLHGVSDRNFLETYGISDDSRITSRITLQRVERDRFARLRVLGFRSLRVGDNNALLPGTAAQAEQTWRIGLGHTALGGEARIILGARAHHRSSATARDVGRAFVQLDWRRSAVLPGGILGAVALQGRIDRVGIEDDAAYPDPVTRRAVQGMVEFRWPFMAADEGGASHVLEPVAQLIASRTRGGPLPNDDHTMPELDSGNLFALTRYSGSDARDDGQRLNAGLRWTRHDAAGWSSEALVGRVWRDGPIDGFDPTHSQPLGGLRSDWLLAGRLDLGRGTSMAMRLLLDDSASLSRAESNLTWSGRSVDVTSRYLFAPASTFEDRTTDLSEWRIDLVRRHSSGWTARLGWDYDVAQNLFATARTGLEFRNECLLFDLTMARHFVTATNPSASTRFNMRLELLGIGGRAPVVNGRSCRA